jgi:hypothetical protein
MFTSCGGYRAVRVGRGKAAPTVLYIATQLTSSVNTAEFPKFDTSSPWSDGV